MSCQTIFCSRVEFRLTVGGTYLCGVLNTCEFSVVNRSQPVVTGLIGNSVTYYDRQARDKCTHIYLVSALLALSFPNVHPLYTLYAKHSGELSR